MHSLKRGVGASVLYGSSSIVVNIALLPLIISTVGAAPYGIWLLLTTLSTYLYQADLGMGSAVVHFLSRDREHGDVRRRQAVVSCAFFWMSLATLVALPLYAVIATLIIHFRGDEAGVGGEAATTLGLLGGILVCGLALRVFPAALQGTGNWVYEQSNQLVGVVVRAIGTAVACLAIGSIEALAVAETVALLTPLVLSGLRAHALGLTSVSRRLVTRAHLRTLFSYSVRSFTVGAMAAILLQANMFIVGAVLNAASVTYYSAVFRIYLAIRQVLGWTTSPLLPAMSRLFARDPARAREMVIGMLFASLWLGVGICGVFFVAGSEILRLWLGPDIPNAEMTLTLTVLLAGLVLNSTHIPAIPATDATGRPGAFLPLHMSWCVLNLGLGLSLGAALGLVGVALGMSLPLLLLEPLYLLKIRDTLGISVAEWAGSCLVPTVTTFSVAMLVAGVAYALASAADLQGAAELGAGTVFACAYFFLTLLRRDALPLSQLRSLANSQM